MMIYISITNFIRISYIEKDHSMIEMRRFKNLKFFWKQKTKNFSETSRVD